MAEFILGIDAGGTAVKAAVYSLTGDELGATAQPFRPLTPAPGHNERDPEQLWLGLATVIRAAMQKAGVTGADVAAVGITGYGNGLYLLDRAGNPVTNGILSSDQRASGLVEQFRAEGKEPEHIALTYKPFYAGNPAPLLAWFKQHRPEVLASAATMLTCKDYLRYRLTGEIRAELTDQSTSCLLGGATRGFDKRIFALSGTEDLMRLLPKMIEPTAIAGTITAAAAAATGLREGTPVPAGTTDNIAVMFGTGAIEPGEMVIMSGTWGLQQVFLDRLINDGDVGYVCHTMMPRRWIYCEGSPSSAASFEWLVDTFMRRPDRAEPPDAVYELCNSAIARTDPDEPPVYFLPFLNGAYDQPQARAALIGFATWHHLGHAVRAVYEGVAFEHRRHYERLLRILPRPKRARFCGGVVRSRPWMEIFASALDLTLDVPKGAEFGARGVAMLAGVTCGKFADIPAAAKAMTGFAYEVAPDPRLRASLDRRYPEYLRLIAALAPHWRGAGYV